MKLKFKRGTKEALDEHIGSPGELAIDTTDFYIRIFDGVTKGGKVIASLNTFLSDDEVHRVTNDASNYTEGELDVQRLDIASLFSRVKIKYDDKRDAWYGKGGSMTGDPWAKSPEDATYEEDEEGRISKITETVDGSDRISEFEYEGDDLVKLETTYRGVKRTETYTYDDNGTLIGMSAEEKYV